MQKVFIAIPSNDGVLEPAMMTSLDAERVGLAKEGIVSMVHIHQGDSILPNARNVLAGVFKQTDFTDLIYWDDDVSCQPGDLKRLLSYPVDVVLGVYRLKKDDIEYPVLWLDDPNGNGLWADPDTGLLKVKAGPAGFMRLTRAAVEKVVESRKEYNYTVPGYPGVECWCLFDHEYSLEAKQYRGEDFVFLQRWRELGGDVWVDPELDLGHTGKTTFRGKLGSWLRNRNRPLPSAADLSAMREHLSSPEMQKLFKQAAGEAA